MNIQTFNVADEANEFGETVDVKDIVYTEGSLFRSPQFVVFYEYYLNAEGERQKKIEEDEREARKGLIQSEMHLVYLNEVNKTMGDKEIESGLKMAKESILNHKAKLAAVELWKQ